MIETAENLFLLWDGDGEGSLSQDELIRAFVRIGLSQDHNFAKKIMYSIKKIGPQLKEAQDEEEFEIKLKEFLTIFKNDEISDRVINMINQEVNNRKKVLEQKKRRVKVHQPLYFEDTDEVQNAGTFDMN